ncbi:uncharacterized protein LOC62_02G002091 [Vanrija pseudolonga]|uniref:MAGE domain-containing protein n=1 Tax=Vanrija pseudolonga TaxID=143232 RepID=A0AAF0Y5D2_9TREE|nr:hypothetical protein LOC62_02G002091 [Vanrija pseudolonga]
MPPRRGQPSQSQSQRPRVSERRQATESSGEEDDDRQQAAAGNGNSAEHKALGAQIVRLALFSEYRRQPLRREVIVKTVMPNNPRAFQPALQEAQALLRSTFGMELYELRPKRKGDGEDEATQAQTQAQTQTQRRKGKGRAREGEGEEDEDEVDEDGAQTQGQTQTQSRKRTNMWILRSTLAPGLLAGMSNPEPLPLPDEVDEQQTAELQEDSGALLRWDKGDGTGVGHVGLLGVRTVILALILVRNRKIEDNELHAYLRRLNLTRDTVLPYHSEDSKEPPLTLDKYLELLTKLNYLEKVGLQMFNRTRSHTQVVTRSTAGPAEPSKIEWRWGSREAEFSEKAAAEFIVGIVFEGEESDSEDEAPVRGRRAAADDEPRLTREQKRARLLKNVEKAAGEPLAGWGR